MRVYAHRDDERYASVGAHKRAPYGWSVTLIICECLDLGVGAKRPPHGGGFEASWKLLRTVSAENGRSPDRALLSEAG